MGDFPSSKKAAAYNKSNTSKVNMMPSHEAMELKKGQEKTLFPGAKAGRATRYAANQSNVFAHKDPRQQALVKALPTDFTCYKEKPDSFHNKGNSHVQARRLFNGTSKVF